SFEGAESVARIVRSMKAFSHPGTEDKAYLDINEAIESTATVSRNEWKYVADMTLNLDPSIPMVRGYAGELSQVFLNLIVNAAHAIGDATEGGKAGKRGITITTRHRQGIVEISISDAGIGIPVEIRERIFDPFFTTKAVGKGTGQGLSMAYSTIVERHNGSIDFLSEVGKGTTFRISLPVDGKEE
ncbi:MAG: hypothetical protein KDD70_09060, partial [Bdellovibrionales bacterium]|nr:hypothetical protein [Bdellovibrionales bacterium]